MITEVTQKKAKSLQQLKDIEIVACNQLYLNAVKILSEKLNLEIKQYHQEHVKQFTEKEGELVNNLMSSLELFLENQVETDESKKMQNFTSPRNLKEYLEDQKDNISEEVYNVMERLITPHQIRTAFTTYDLLMVYFSIYPIYEELFLFSSEARRALLTNGCVFGKDNHGKLLWCPLSDLGKLEIMNLSTESLYVWWGCHLSLPINTKVMLSFSKMYPNMYVKREKSREDGGSDEIFLEENPWSVNYVYDKNMIQKVEEQGQIIKSNSGNVGTNKQQGMMTFFSKNKSADTSSQQVKDSENSFKKVDIFVDAIVEDCEIIVMLPYMPPKADMLLTMKFDQNDENKEEVILTSS